MTSPQQRMPQNSLSFRGSVIIYFFITMVLLYILYSNLLLSNDSKDCPDLTNLSTKIEAPINYSSTSSSPVEKAAVEQRQEVELVKPSPGNYHRYDTELKHIAFGIAASSNLWEIRKEYIKTRWRPGETRGVVRVDKKVKTRRN
ncbi:hypothetical protein DITRI_Ditri05aG0023000 [Diplodiscus trichospermus]